MILGDYALTLLLLIGLIGLCGVFSFEKPPMEYVPYCLSLVALWASFGFIMGSEPK